MSAGWRTVALVSLAANLLIVGGLVGGYAAGARFQPPRMAQANDAGPARALLQALPQSERAAMRRELARTFVDARAMRKEARDARTALAQTALAEPYDPAAVKAALARMRAADAALAGRFHDAVADAFAKMSPEERRQALRALAQRRADTRPGVARPAPREPEQP